MLIASELHLFVIDFEKSVNGYAWFQNSIENGLKWQGARALQELLIWLRECRVLRNALEVRVDEKPVFESYEDAFLYNH